MENNLNMLRETSLKAKTGQSLPGVYHKEQEIRMPQMANGALSENWLLKEMGDIHWEMLSNGLEQKSSEFSDGLGNRLYATFVRINYSISPLHRFMENDTLYLDAEMKRFGDYAYYSIVKGRCGDKSLHGNLMTSFSARKDNDNAQMTKSSPEKKINHIEEYEETPAFYVEHGRVRKNLLRELHSGDFRFVMTNAVIESIEHTINPYYEINGVGLLYFAAYPMIADECNFLFLKKALGINDFGTSWTTVFRDIFYFANCNVNDSIRVDLNSIEHVKGNKMQITNSLYRVSDKKLMGKIITVKQKVE
jgi:probable biosynthetic protein (TIGR04098 family)